MNRERAARAYDLIAEGFAELAVAVREPVDSPAARTGDAGAEGVPPSPAPAPSLQEQHVDTVLAQCPDHQVPWTIKPGGVSKAGKPYNAFWRCNQSTNGEYCQKRPVKAWQDRHPITEGAAA